MNKQARCIAPGKIILSGEHAVAYGKPALGMAVNAFVDVIITPDIYSNKQITCEFMDSKLTSQISINDLVEIKNKLDERYAKFLCGECNIKEVITNPFELINYTIASIASIASLNLNIKDGFKVQIKSAIPIGSGMGSSSAIILSVMHVLINYFSSLPIILPILNMEEYWNIGRKIENLQHGKSSGFDMFLSLHGGCYLFADDKFSRRDIPELPLFIINTGKPQSSTGECVAHAANFFTKSRLADDFADVTLVFDNALQNNDFVLVKKCIKENHKLLQSIKVVPEKVSAFINDIEKNGGAAKISGAGSVAGNEAGAVIVFGELSIIKQEAIKYGYELLLLKQEFQGVRNV